MGERMACANEILMRRGDREVECVLQKRVTEENLGRDRGVSRVGAMASPLDHREGEDREMTKMAPSSGDGGKIEKEQKGVGRK